LGLSEVLNQTVEVRDVSSKFLQITVRCHSEYQMYNFGLQGSNHTNCL